jgi:RND family efflux transporter MFP subunit
MKIVNNYKGIIGGVIFVIGGAIYIGFILSLKASDDKIEKTNKKSVKTVIVSAGTSGAFGEYAGFVRGVDQAILTTKINGRILSLNKKEGERVKKGEILAVLSADELTAQIRGAKNTILELEKTLKDTRKYYNQKVDEAKDSGASDEEIQSAKKMRDLQIQSMETEIVSARGSLQVAQSYQGETVVKAPFGGVVAKVFQEVGQVVGPTMPIFEIANDTQYIVELFVSQSVVKQLNKGDVISLICGDKKEVCQGKIDFIGPISPANGQKSLVQISFSDKDPAIYLGQYVEARLVTSNKEQSWIVIPEEAVISKYNEKFVFVVEDNLAKERKIKIGQFYDGMVIVESGLSQGEKLIVKGMYLIRNNDKVDIYE